MSGQPTDACAGCVAWQAAFAEFMPKIEALHAEALADVVRLRGALRDIAYGRDGLDFVREIARTALNTSERP